MKDYKNGQLKSHMWIEIGQILNLNGDTCNARWTYIRDYYVRRKVKPITGSCSEATIKRSAMLSFLDSFRSQKANTYTNVVACTNQGQPSTSQSFEQTESLGDCTFESELPGEEFPSCVDSEDAERPPPKKVKVTHAQERLDLLKELVMSKVAAPSDPDDAVDLFYRSVAATVKQFPIMDQMRMQCKVSELLADMVEKNSGPESRPSSPDFSDLDDLQNSVNRFK
ncbi:hypothetical protein JTE90_024880 [Oedothorax gibbosus]|uniref:MADF domain-containing protein n=1 Tax=Oedothorax gibbosus TaxID=931172 RepID=A0AAV6V207_9ARAC|nr:hypothetical protein JTE90_024880 [Oedothorax gibbosus]